jgi:hypothetical protein
MKMTQIIGLNWNNGKGLTGYTLLALGEDGIVYKSMGYRKAQHSGWLPLSDNVLPADFETGAKTADDAAAEVQAA